jgi:hypothetical protein
MVLLYCGQRVDDLTREELIEALKLSHMETVFWRERCERDVRASDRASCDGSFQPFVIR